MNADIANNDLTVCWKGSALRIPELYKPRRDGWWCEDWDAAGEKIERPKGKVVRVCMREEDPVECGQIG
jgi:hypothetical protein